MFTLTTSTVFAHGVSYLCDNREILNSIPDKSIDLVLTDPPYIVHTSGGSRSRFSRRAKKITENMRQNALSEGFDWEYYFGEFLRVCKIPNILIFCSNDQVPNTMKFFMDRNISTTLLVWNKTNPIPTRNSHYIPSTEYIVYVHGKRATYNYKGLPVDYNRKVYTSPVIPAHKRVHPTQKPQELVSRLIQVHSNKHDTILDPFAGSGTTGLVASSLERYFMLMENNEDFYSRQIEYLKSKIPQVRV